MGLPQFPMLRKMENSYIKDLLNPFDLVPSLGIDGRYYDIFNFLPMPSYTLPVATAYKSLESPTNIRSRKEEHLLQRLNQRDASYPNPILS